MVIPNGRKMSVRHHFLWLIPIIRHPVIGHIYFMRRNGIFHLPVTCHLKRIRKKKCAVLFGILFTAMNMEK